MSENMCKKMKLLGALATATGVVINLECTSDLTFASTIFLSDILLSLAGIAPITVLLWSARLL